MNPHLFLFYVGGEVEGATIEVHDVQFVAAETREAAHPVLRSRWWGTPSSLHIDTCTRVTWADGYDVSLSNDEPTGVERLWFVNLGGYRPKVIGELHACGLFVAATAAEARAKAKASLLTGATLQHTDDQVDVDDCLQLAEVDGLHVHLAPNPSGSDDGQPEFQGYLPIGDRTD